MSATDHLGEHILRVYHSSRSVIPPHDVTKGNDPDLRKLRQEDYKQGTSNTNTHPDIIHAGTLEAAKEIGGGGGWHTLMRPYMHAYDIDVSEMSPVTYGDAPGMEETQKFKKRLAGEQQSLWESVPSTGEETLQHGRVQPYRNNVEDEGSISYMIPKSAIGTGRVRYVGEVNKGSK